MKKVVPEKCCANCKYLLAYPRNNAYGDIDYLCVKIGRYIVGRYKNIEKATFYHGDGVTIHDSSRSKCTFQKKVGASQ